MAWQHISLNVASESNFSFRDYNKLKVFFVVVIVPMTLNTLQFVIQDTFLKKSDFEITDVDIMRKYYDCTDMEDLETSLTGIGIAPSTELQSKTEAKPKPYVPEAGNEVTL